MGEGGGGGLIDMSELKKLVNEMNQGLEFENLNKDGSHSHIRFKSSKFMTDFLANLREFQEAEKFCDVVLRVGVKSE